MRPKSATTIPSLHFKVAPPRKQARTGRAGTARFNHQRAGAPVKLAGVLLVLVFAVGIGGGRRGSWYGISSVNQQVSQHRAGSFLPRVERRPPWRTLSFDLLT